MTPIHFSYSPQGLNVESIALNDVAERFGTPCYVYSRAALVDAYESYRLALQSHPNTLICYAVKANSSLAILNLFARLGAGFDIVSGGELERVLVAGGNPAKIVFSGVGKTRQEIELALRKGIHCFNVESASELLRLNNIAGLLNLKAPVSLRVNPDVDPKTHPYISTGLKNNKFGVPFEEALPLYRQAAALPNLKLTGIDCHIGSQLLDPAPATEAARKIIELVDQLAAEGIVLQHIDLGGGMGITYHHTPTNPVNGESREGNEAAEKGPTPTDYYKDILELLKGRSEKLIVEPGRSLVGNVGVLLTRVEVLKHGPSHHFAIVDAAMNDLMRPALYDAWHDILPVVPRNDTEAHRYEIVGPVCESGDFLGHERQLALREGDLLAILSAGAYGMAMSSNYNTRPRAAEVMVDGDQIHLIRKREEIAQLYANENLLP